MTTGDGRKRDVVLIAEDDAAVREGFAELLAGEGYAVRCAADGEEALASWRASRPDLVLLDVMMPRMNGFAVCREIRSEDPDLPVIFLTARTSGTDELHGLDLGANDYISKTAPEAVVMKRVANALAACRRAAGTAVPDFPFGEWRVDAAAQRLVRDGRSVPVTLKEIEILRYFRAHPGEVVSNDFLQTRFWGVDSAGTENMVSAALSRLRRKFAPDALIRTVYGSGFVYDGDVCGT